MKKIVFERFELDSYPVRIRIRIDFNPYSYPDWAKMLDPDQQSCLLGKFMKNFFCSVSMKPCKKLKKITFFGSSANFRENNVTKFREINFNFLFRRNHKWTFLSTPILNKGDRRSLLSTWHYTLQIYTKLLNFFLFKKISKILYEFL
jgi:hypothetical protein